MSLGDRGRERLQQTSQSTNYFACNKLSDFCLIKGDIKLIGNYKISMIAKKQHGTNIKNT